MKVTVESNGLLLEAEDELESDHLLRFRDEWHVLEQPWRVAGAPRRARIKFAPKPKEEPKPATPNYEILGFETHGGRHYVVVQEKGIVSHFHIPHSGWETRKDAIGFAFKLSTGREPNENIHRFVRGRYG